MSKKRHDKFSNEDKRKVKTPLRKPPRMEGKVQNIAIKPIKKKKKSEKT